MNKKKVVIGLILLVLVGFFFVFDLQQYFNLEYFQSQRQAILDFKAQNFWLASLLFFFLYLTIVALSLPAAVIFTLAGGAIFGFWWGLLLVSFASSMGATLAFIFARTLFRNWVLSRFGNYLRPINHGIEKDGAFYLFTLRIIPIVPFFLVNVLMAFTPIKARQFYWVSQVGMLFVTALYVNVGAELGSSENLPDILSGGLVGTLIALALFPWVTKLLLSIYQDKKILRSFKKPKSFDVNMVVIGAGSAGLVTALIASLVKAKVILIEKHRMGGDCLNTGCVPSKALIRSASVNHLIGRAHEFGLASSNTQVDFKAVMDRVKTIISKIEPHDSVERYTEFGVECIQGAAKITSPYSVNVNGKDITTRNIIIATGARPFVPSIQGLENVEYYTSDTIWNLELLPSKMLVVGGGSIGCELAQAFSRLGSDVTQVSSGGRILSREDEDVSAYITKRFNEENIRLLNKHKLLSFEKQGDVKIAVAECDGKEVVMEFDTLLLAVGRKANTEGFGLEALDVPLNDTGNVAVNKNLQTSYPNIYACGDVAGPYQFTHMASFQAWYASVNSLFRGFKKFKVNYSVVPWATFVDPEIARVGLNESEAKQKNIPYEVTRYDLDDLDRAIADSEDHGFIKILTVPGKDKILGATIVGYHAAELITEFVTAMTHGLGLKKIMATIHIYPTLAESNKFAASEWRKQHAPEWIYPYLEKFHTWRRK